MSNDIQTENCTPILFESPLTDATDTTRNFIFPSSSSNDPSPEFVSIPVSDVCKVSNFSKNPKMLDLFSGSRNVGNYFSTRGFEVYSIDSDPKCHATEIIDIMDWSYTKFPPNYFLVIAAGVPCTE